MNKVFKGVIHSILPQKGYGFIKPNWAKTSEDNIYFYLPATKVGHKCFIPALQSAENRVEVITKTGVKVVTPTVEQVVYFELEEQMLPSGVKKLKAVNLTDEGHTPETIKEKAAVNSVTVPNLQEKEPEVVTPVTEDIPVEKDIQVDEEDACDFEEDYDDYDDCDYSEYDEYEEYYDKPQKPKQNKNKGGKYMN